MGSHGVQGQRVSPGCWADRGAARASGMSLDLKKWEALHMVRGEKLYVVYGAGPDSVGLVERITASVAEVGGNIIDLRQDVLHGLFTVSLVVDMGAGTLRLEQFRERMREVSEDTGLDLHTDKYVPAARGVETRKLLLVLVGRDRAGIVSRVSHDLSAHEINIEFSRMTAREDVFLMELVTDVSQSTLPQGNLEAVVREHMASVGISSMFQGSDVYNPKKRVILFSISGSLIAPEVLAETLEQAGIDRSLVAGGDSAVETLRAAAARLDRLPVEVFRNVVRAVRVTPGTRELVQSLKRMGYRVALAAHAFSPVTDFLKEELGLDHAFGPSLPVDDDSQAIMGELAQAEFPALEGGRVMARLAAREGVEREDISIIHDRAEDTCAPPGIRVDFDMRLALDYLNQHILDHDTLAGALGSFGLVRPLGPKE